MLNKLRAPSSPSIDLAVKSEMLWALAMVANDGKSRQAPALTWELVRVELERRWSGSGAPRNAFPEETSGAEAKLMGGAPERQLLLKSEKKKSVSRKPFFSTALVRR